MEGMGLIERNFFTELEKDLSGILGVRGMKNCVKYFSYSIIVYR
jgi:hypothetical protein